MRPNPNFDGAGAAHAQLHPRGSPEGRARRSPAALSRGLDMFKELPPLALLRLSSLVRSSNSLALLRAISSPEVEGFFTICIFVFASKCCGGFGAKAGAMTVACLPPREEDALVNV